MRTRLLNPGFLFSTLVAAALWVGPASEAEDASVSDAKVKQLLQSLGAGDAKSEVKLKELITQLRAILASLELQTAAADASEDDAQTSGSSAEEAPAAKPAIAPKAAGGTAGLQAGSLQASTGVTSGARGRTPEAEWRQLFPKK